MTQEDKELLLKDLCARLPYKIFAQWHHKALNKFRDVRIMKVSTYGKNIDDYYINVLCQPEPGVDYEASIVDIKPYLRPMSSMTEEEYKEFRKLKQMSITVIMPNGVSRIKPTYTVDLEDNGDGLNYLYDWLNSHYFDYRGLIEKGLALKAQEGMYKNY